MPEWTTHLHEPQCRLPNGHLAWISITTERVWCYCDGEYLGTEQTVSAGKRRAESGKKGDYVMELETTEEAWAALKPRPKKWKWELSPNMKETFVSVVDGEKLPARIRALDKKTWAAYRDGRYLGSEATRDLAEKRCQVGAVSQRNRVMALWEKEHPNELPPFLQLTQEERDEYWRRNPPVKAQRPALGLTKPKLAGGGDPAADAKPPKAARVPRAGKATAESPKGTLVLVSGVNPKKPGSGAAKRWDALFEAAKAGRMVAEYAAAGGNLDTLANAMAKGCVRVEEK